MQGQPIPSPRTRSRPEPRRETTRSDSRRRRTTSSGRGGRSEAAAVEDSASSPEDAPTGPTVRGGMGGGTYEFGSSSQQPLQPQPLSVGFQGEVRWPGPELQFASSGGPGDDDGHTPRSRAFFDTFGIPRDLRPPAP